MWYHEHDRRGPLPDRRHLVADRDRRDHDLAAARRDADQARFLHAAAAGHRGRRSSMTHGKRVKGADAGGYLVIRKPWPSMLRTIWGDNDRYLRDLLGEVQQPLLRCGRQRAPRQGRLLLDHGPHRRRAERRRPPPRHDGNRVRAGGASAGGGGCRRRQAARDQGRVGVRVRRVPRRATHAATPSALVEGAARLGGRAVGAIAKPDDIRFADNLPKTRSGKIMRRLLRRSRAARRSPRTSRRWRTRRSSISCAGEQPAANDRRRLRNRKRYRRPKEAGNRNQSRRLSPR